MQKIVEKGREGGRTEGFTFHISATLSRQGEWDCKLFHECKLYRVEFSVLRQNLLILDPLLSAICTYMFEEPLLDLLLGRADEEGPGRVVRLRE